MRCRFIALALGLALLFCNSFCQAQYRLPVLYAFSRDMIGGAAPQISASENGTAISKRQGAAPQYFIYLECSAAQAIEINAVWIAGKAYSIQKTLIKTPVIIGNGSLPNHPQDTLIKANKNNVWQISVIGMQEDKPQRKTTQALIKSNAIVLQYSIKGSTHSLAQHAFNKLSPVVMQ